MLKAEHRGNTGETEANPCSPKAAALTVALGLLCNGVMASTQRPPAAAMRPLVLMQSLGTRWHGDLEPSSVGGGGMLLLCPQVKFGQKT